MNDHKNRPSIENLYKNDDRLIKLNEQTHFWDNFQKEPRDKWVSFSTSIANKNIIINDNKIYVEQKTDTQDYKVIKFILESDQNQQTLAFISTYKTNNISEDYAQSRFYFFSYLNSTSTSILPFLQFHNIGTSSIRFTNDLEPNGKVFWVYKNAFIIVENSGISEELFTEICYWLQQQLENNLVDN